jgi:hypothetical protein
LSMDIPVPNPNSNALPPGWLAGKNRRSIADYMRELDEEAGRADCAAIVIGYDQGTCFVWSMGEAPAVRLEALLQAGGRAVAILGAKLDGNAFICELNPFPEYEEDARMRKYLEAVGATVADMLDKYLAAALN